MAKRATPCIECLATETAMAYRDTPWCGDRCHKAVAAKVGRTQKDLTVELWEAGTDRLLEATRDTVLHDAATIGEL